MLPGTLIGVLCGAVALLCLAGVTGAGAGQASAAAPPASSAWLPIDGDRAVELRSDRLVAVVRTRPWRLELRDRWTNALVFDEYPVEPRGVRGAMVGSLGFLAPANRFSTDSLASRWYRATSVLALRVQAGGLAVLTATDDPSGRRLEVELRFLSPTALAVRVTPQPSDGVLEVAEGLTSAADEHYLGLGARFTSLDARGLEVRSRVQGQPDTIDPAGNHLPVPFLVSSRSYGIALNGMDEGVFQLNTVRPDAAVFKTRATSLSFTVFTGRTPLDVVAEYTRATGPPLLPPLWAFGVWKTVMGGEAQVLAEVERLERAEIPVTALWSYDMVDEGRHLGWRRWVYRRASPGPYPDLRELIRVLRSRGYRALGYLSPEFRTDSPLFAVGAGRGYFIRDRRDSAFLYLGMQGHPVALLDFTNPGAVQWWQSLVTSILGDLGFDGWMQDGGDTAPEDGVYASAVTGRAARNGYPALYAAATHAAAVRARPDYVSFMRSGFAGSQRHTALTWPCDNTFSWSRRDGLPAALRATLSGSLSGFPIWAPDIGGYSGCGQGSPLDEELWIRWVQLGALHPVMRDHLGDKCWTAVDLWSSPATVEVFRRYARLHHQLVPYFYALALEAVETGRPPMRPVGLVSPNDPRAWKDEFTYLLGEDILVAPVMDPGARERQVFLPAGEWVDWWDWRRYRGPGVVTVPAPLERIPVLVRAGSLLPLADASGSFTRIRSDSGAQLPLVLRVHPASADWQRSRLKLYDGGQISAWQGDPAQLILEISRGPRGHPLLVSLADPEPPRAVRADVGDLDWQHDAVAGETTITVPERATRITIVRRVVHALD